MACGATARSPTAGVKRWSLQPRLHPRCPGLCRSRHRPPHPRRWRDRRAGQGVEGHVPRARPGQYHTLPSKGAPRLIEPGANKSPLDLQPRCPMRPKLQQEPMATLSGLNISRSARSPRLRKTPGPPGPPRQARSPATSRCPRPMRPRHPPVRHRSSQAPGIFRQRGQVMRVA